jgi:hypothetical protein
LSDQHEIRRRIEARISQGEFLVSLLRVARQDSTKVQEQFVDELSGIAAMFRGILEQYNLIHRLEYKPTDFWAAQRGKIIAFVDGGVANIELPSAAPIGIRVGSYVVRLGDTSDVREKFNIELSLVDDLYSPRGHIFNDDFEDLAKLRDVARMTSETAAAYRLAKEGAADLILLHGPLINPVAPYGLQGFPPFGLNACRTFRDDPNWTGEDVEYHFVPTYRDVLEAMRDTNVPVLGVVERSVGREPVVVKRLLYRMEEQKILKALDVKKIIDTITPYGLNDATLFDVVLGEGEYVDPIAVDRQGPDSKWPEEWKPLIRGYPKALTVYLKPSEAVVPFRIEAFEGVRDHEAALDLVMHTSRLLPSYGFPVGLDIVDKFAKVPSWMSRSVKGQHQIALLKKALQSGDPRVIAFAKRVLVAKGRDWFFRPSA